MLAQDVLQLVWFIRHSKSNLGVDYSQGSPAYGTIRYELPEWHMHMIKKTIRVNVRDQGREQDVVFGRVVTGYYVYDVIHIHHAECEVELKVLDMWFQKHKPGYADQYWVDDPEPGDWEFTLVGNSEPLQEALAYFRLMCTFDN